MARRPNATQLSPCAVAAGGKRGHRGHGQGHPSGFASGPKYGRLIPVPTGLVCSFRVGYPGPGVRAIFILLWQCRVGQVRTRGMETITGPCLVSRSDLGKYLNLQTTADTNRRPNAWKCLRKPPLLPVESQELSTSIEATRLKGCQEPRVRSQERSPAASTRWSHSTGSIMVWVEL